MPLRPQIKAFLQVKNPPQPNKNKKTEPKLCFVRLLLLEVVSLLLKKKVLSVSLFVLTIPLNTAVAFLFHPSFCFVPRRVRDTAIVEPVPLTVEPSCCQNPHTMGGVIVACTKPERPLSRLCRCNE